MNRRDYEFCQLNVVMAAKKIEGLDLDAFIATAKQALGVGPIIDPTLFIKASPNLQAIVTLAETMKPVQEALAQLRKAARETLEAGHATAAHRMLEEEDDEPRNS